MFTVGYASENTVPAPMRDAHSREMLNSTCKAEKLCSHGAPCRCPAVTSRAACRCHACLPSRRQRCRAFWPHCTSWPDPSLAPPCCGLRTRGSFRGWCTPRLSFRPKVWTHEQASGTDALPHESPLSRHRQRPQEVLEASGMSGPGLELLPRAVSRSTPQGGSWRR